MTQKIVITPADLDDVTVKVVGNKVTAVQPDLSGFVIGGAVEGNTLKLTTKGADPVSVELPAQTVDIKLTGAELVNETTLKLTLSDGSELDVDLAKFLNIDTNTVVSGVSREESTLKITSSDSSSVTTALSELQSLGGESLGYLVE